MTVWNVCLTHDPMYGGLYRAVNDFAAAIPANILSFDDGRRDRMALTQEDHACRIGCGDGFFTRDCLLLSANATRDAERLVADAQLLVVHSMFRGHATWVADWSRRNTRPFWAVPHGCLDPWALKRHRAAKTTWLMLHGSQLLGNAEHVIFSTRRESEKARPWLTRYNAHAHQEVIHWPVALPPLSGRDAARSMWRARHGIPDTSSLLLFVGRLHTMKRPLETVAAFCRSANATDHLALVGMDGDIRREDVLRAVPRTYAGQVHVVGQLSGQELHSAWLSADGFISLSFRENFGYSAAEALSYELPVILSPGHDLAHEMPQGSTGSVQAGWLLPDDSLPSAVEAMTAFFLACRASRNALTAMGVAGRQWVGEALSPAQFAARLRQLQNRRG